MKKRIEQLVLLSSVLVILGQHFGVNRNFYATIFEYDSLMHIFGGMWAGSIGMLFCHILNNQFKISDKRTIKILLISYSIYSALAVGALWEVLECYKFHPEIMPFWDTVLDLIMDILGGFLISLGILNFKPKNKQKEASNADAS